MQSEQKYSQRRREAELYDDDEGKKEVQSPARKKTPTHAWM